MDNTFQASHEITNLSNKSENKKAINALVVLITLLSLLLFFYVITKYTKTQEPNTIIINNNNAITYPVSYETQNTRLALKGYCSIPGFKFPYDTSAAPCELIKPSTSEVIKQIKNCPEGDLTGSLQEDICVGFFSSVTFGKSDNNIQYLYMNGGEGGANWINIFALDTQTNIITKVETARTNIDASSTDFDALATEYNIFYYDTLTIENADLNSVNMYLAESRKLLIPINTDECNDLKGSKAYTSGCFSNWNILSTSEQEKVKSNLDFAYSKKL